MSAITFLALIFTTVVSGATPSNQVHQTPPDMVVAIKSGATVTLNCSHSIENYNTILWYKQQCNNKQLKLLGYIYSTFATPEMGLDGEMSGSAGQHQTARLTIQNISVESSAVYFCAASRQGTEPAFFGKGTKLTVLEPLCNVSPPTVVVLPPSEKECRDRKKQLKKTLVCVASGFYPDHVGVSWTVNGQSVIKGVASDHPALRVGDKYQITSRLRVEAREWYTEGTIFTCNVSFFNGTDTFNTSAEVYGSGDVNGTQTDAMTREEFVKVTQTAKLSYIVMIVKNIVYGVFVTILAWKLGIGRSHATAKK